LLAITLTAEGNKAEEINLNEGDSQLELLQKAVGGLIEAVDLGDNLTMWVNEEGKMYGLPINPMATMLWEKHFGFTDIIVGDVIFTGGTGSEGETLGLNAETAEELRKLFNL
jgi:hypothetical protein